MRPLIYTLRVVCAVCRGASPGDSEASKDAKKNLVHHWLANSRTEHHDSVRTRLRGLAQAEHDRADDDDDASHASVDTVAPPDGQDDGDNEGEEAEGSVEEGEGMEEDDEGEEDEEGEEDDEEEDETFEPQAKKPRATKTGKGKRPAICVLPPDACHCTVIHLLSLRVWAGAAPGVLPQIEHDVLQSILDFQGRRKKGKTFTLKDILKDAGEESKIRNALHRLKTKKFIAREEGSRGAYRLLKKK